MLLGGAALGKGGVLPAGDEGGQGEAGSDELAIGVLPAGVSVARVIGPV
jgi:hypothetical protein